jgi:hypothetical protein
MSRSRFALLLTWFVAGTAACNDTPAIDDQDGDGSPCQLDIEVSGGQFSPNACDFQIITPGVPCDDNQACPPDYTIAMRDEVSGHIGSLLLFGFATYSADTFYFDPAASQSEFNGQVTDRDFAARNLTLGEVSLEPVEGLSGGEGVVEVTFDLSFATDIHIVGSGRLPVHHHAAP